MSRLRVSVVLDAPPVVVWEDVRHIASHVQWMADAVAIRFTSDTTEGVGTTFDCDTKVGPVRLTDRMEITRWDPGVAMGVRHVGLVTGTGEFRLKALRRGRTKFSWTERLDFPWWMGGAAGSWAAVPVLTLVWRHSLRTLAARYADD